MNQAVPPPKDVKPGTIEARIIPGVTEDVAAWLRPCKPSRDWMDATPQKFIYRCIPLTAANTMGWELLNPIAATVRWNGGPMNGDLTVTTKTPHPFAAASHFGCGIVTWYVPFLFRTPPDMGLVVTGPANQGHDDAVPLDAFIRTDWLPFPFTMNWRLTRKDKDIEFTKGEPICRFYPFPIALLEETQLEISKLESDPGFLAEVNQFGKARQQNVAKQQADAAKWQATGEKPKGEGVWNAQYVKAGRSKEDGQKTYTRHQTIFKCKPPKQVD